jgi:VWFA-related protein
MKRIVLVVTVLLAGAGSHALSQQTPPTFRSGRDVLTVEASVRDSAGRPVTDLQASDFLVSIDGKPRRVLDATIFSVDADRITAPVTPLPRFARAVDATPGRLVVVAVDRDSIQPGSERAVLDATSAMLASLSPADAVGAIGLPIGGIEPTRDHAAAAAAIRLLTGTRPRQWWRYNISWDEALGFERGDTIAVARVIERECSRDDPRCPRDLQRQAQEMLLQGRGQVQIVLKRLADLLDRLSTIRAPKHLVLLSGGLPFDQEFVSRYRDLATKAAQARVALFVVHVDQPSSDVSDRFNASTVFGGRDYASGLGNISSITGGLFVNAVGGATGAFDRIVSDINYFYQLAVEVQPSDADGKARRLQVRVSRPSVSVRAPSETAAAPAPKPSADDAVTRALFQPTDIAELPLEVATYATHADEPNKVRVLVSATLADAPRIVPAEWGYVVLDGGKVIGGSRDAIAPSSQPWLATASLDVPSGRYRIRAALVSADGRVATLDLPMHAGLRAAGAVLASDLIVGIPGEGRLQPRARLKQGDAGVAMIELSSSESLAGTTGTVELVRAGTAQPALRRALDLRARANDASIVVAQAPLDLSELTPGTYMASAVLDRGGKPFARISRLIDVAPGAAITTLAPPAASPAAPPRSPATTPRDPALDDVLERVGRYVAGYGEQASLIIAVERYEQRHADAPLGQPSQRKLVAELAMVKTSDRTGWVAFRDVISVDGKPIGDRQDRLQALFQMGIPDLAEARRIADESARFNIGPTRRNFNEPTAALFFLLPSSQARFTFTRKGNTTIAGVTALEIAFKETASPTVIRTVDGRDVAAEGTIWVVPADGTILRTRMVVRGFAGLVSNSSVDVTFARDERLRLWLPVKMTERHEGTIRSQSPLNVPGIRPGASVSVPAVVTTTAIYGDFKRFETSSSISIKE